MDVLGLLCESQLKRLLLTPALQLACQEDVVVQANSCSSVAPSRAETFSTLLHSLAIWHSPGQEVAVCLTPGAVNGLLWSLLWLSIFSPSLSRSKEICSDTSGDCLYFRGVPSETIRFPTRCAKDVFFYFSHLANPKLSGVYCRYSL